MDLPWIWYTFFFKAQQLLKPTISSLSFRKSSVGPHLPVVPISIWFDLVITAKDAGLNIFSNHSPLTNVSEPTDVTKDQQHEHAHGSVRKLFQRLKSLWKWTSDGREIWHNQRCWAWADARKIRQVKKMTEIFYHIPVRICPCIWTSRDSAACCPLALFVTFPMENEVLKEMQIMEAILTLSFPAHFESSLFVIVQLLCSCLFCWLYSLWVHSHWGLLEPHS